MIKLKTGCSHISLHGHRPTGKFAGIPMCQSGPDEHITIWKMIKHQIIYGYRPFSFWFLSSEVSIVSSCVLKPKRRVVPRYTRAILGFPSLAHSARDARTERFPRSFFALLWYISTSRAGTTRWYQTAAHIFSHGLSM